MSPERNFEAGEHVIDRDGEIYTVDRSVGALVYVEDRDSPLQASNLQLVIVRPAPSVPNWYATQRERRVDIHDRDTGTRLASYEPPSEWGDRWAWNLVPHGGGIYFVEQ